MTRFRCVPMDTASARRFRVTRRDDRGGPIMEHVVDGPGSPCRRCLRLGRPGEMMLLASKDLPLPQGPCWTPSPVFLHAHHTKSRGPRLTARRAEAANAARRPSGVAKPPEAAPGD